MNIVYLMLHSHMKEVELTKALFSITSQHVAEYFYVLVAQFNGSLVCSLESVESSIDMDNFIVNYSIVI